MKTKCLLDTFYYRLCKKIGSIKTDFFKQLFVLCSVCEDKIVFVNEGYGCNPRAIAENILNRKLKFKLVWLSDYPINDIPSEITFCTKSSIRGSYHFSTAKVIIFNSKGDRLYFNKKRGQIVIQTHHGTFPLKYVEAECESKLPKEYVKNSKIDSGITDIMLSDSRWTDNFSKTAFWYNGEVYNSGFPRNDIYFDWKPEDKEKIRVELNIPAGKKVVTYAPTFRDNGDFSCYSLDANKLLKALREKTGEEWILLVRAHPNIYFLSGKTLEFDYSENVLDVTSYPDAQRLFLITDLLITDYSSIMIYFILMHKPVLLFATDEEEYVEQRGIRPEYRKLPFPHSKNNLELINNLCALDFGKPYTDEFIKWYGSIDDGHAAERVVNRIIEEVSKN
jgi:CDP-glycerol glycerophosphotransferase